MSNLPGFRRPGAAVALLVALGAIASGCGDDPAETGDAGAGGLGGSVGSASSGPGGLGGAGGAGSTSTSTSPSSGPGGGQTTYGPCAVTIRYASTSPGSNVRVAGEWHGFDLASATPMSGPSASGEYEATLKLAPGLHAYKIVVDEGSGSASWRLNPSEIRRKYVGGEENSAVKVRDCEKPSLEILSSEATRPSASQGAFEASLGYVDAVDASGPHPEGPLAALRGKGGALALPSGAVEADASGKVSVSLSGLADGKYTLTLTPRSKSGKAGEPVRLVFWIEAERFSWEGALVYMVLTDRFKNGDPGNDPGPTEGADPRGDWQGGDLEGLRKAIADGTLDELGVRAIWLTPFQTNPVGAYLASDGVHKVTGYHGYWPVKAREVDPRLGGEEALRAMVDEAHAHGIRILMDYVINHVHESHEYVKQHPDWFRTGCVCGTDGCGWTEKALECMFASYLPDIDHSVPEANARFVEDAVHWLDELDLDGLRVDAVKHVEEVATRNLSAEVRETFEGAGTRYFLMGETAMGWNDCADPCNDENYGTISKYVGPHGLDGQFDFVLYHGVSYRTFAYGESGMLHADYWVKHGLGKWPAGSVMTPYIGSHDTPRFVSLADYRGQDGAHDKGIPGNQWSNTAVAPKDAEPYRRMRIAAAWLFGLPGAPLLYYGDEYGQWGGADPNNRLFWREPSKLSGEEATTLSFVRKLGKARRDLVALRHGGYQTLAADEDTLLYGRRAPTGEAAIVGLTRAGAPQTRSVEVHASLGWAPGTPIQDAMGGPALKVDGEGKLEVKVPASGAVVLHP